MSRMRTLRQLAVVAAALALSLSACSTANNASGVDAPSGPWSFQDGSGKVIKTDKTPTRIIAHASEASALMSFGIKPVGIYADEPAKTDPSLRDLDLTGITILGEEWGKIDVEKAAELNPDLIVADWWPAEKAHSGLESGVEAKSKKLAKLAPVVGVSQGDSVVTLVEGYEDLAESLGADVDDPEIAADKKRFEKAKKAFQAEMAARPNLTVAAMSPYEDKVYVANPEYAPELLDFMKWGMNLIPAANPDKDFPYWETLSMENADKYQPDVMLWDDRENKDDVVELNKDYAKKQPTWLKVKAAAANSVVSWPAFWLHTYGNYATELEQLTRELKAADDSVGDQ